MRTRLKLLVLLTCLHGVLALGATVYAMSAGSVRFDNPGLPQTLAETAAATTAKVLTSPGRLVWTSWASKTLPNVLEWALFIANSALWGAAGVTATTLLSRSPGGREGKE